MPCANLKLASGETAIVCTGRQRQRKCACGRRATLLCDFKADGAKKSCDKPLCSHCAVRIGPDIDHCPSHHTMPAQLPLFAEVR